VALLPGAPLTVAFGLTPWILLAYEVVDAVVTVFSHANLRLSPALERVVRYVVVTPDLHRIHHSSWQPETDSNFGAVFPIWDLVFGTFRAEPRDGHQRMRLGLDGWRGPETRRVGWLLASPFRSQPEPPAAAGRAPQTDVCPVEGAAVASACAAPDPGSWERTASTEDAAAG
jgi:sterol desaturase/sphingolipid hydroxylase (fatty acid hydroxylase superfamily)